MPRFLVYVDADSLAVIDEVFQQVDDGYLDEYFTLTKDGKPIVFDDHMVSNPDKCNDMASRCAGITEK